MRNLIYPTPAYFEASLQLKGRLYHEVTKEAVFEKGCVDVGCHKEGAPNHRCAAHEHLVKKR